jgi:hypothetical protein
MRTWEVGGGDGPQDGITHPRCGKGQQSFAQAWLPAPTYALGLTNPALISQLLSQTYSPKNNKMNITVIKFSFKNFVYFQPQHKFFPSNINTSCPIQYCYWPKMPFECLSL